MKLVKKIIMITTFCLTAGALSAIELVPTQELLAAYLEQDSDLKNLAFELEKANLSKKGTEIDNGFDIRLSTGNMTLRTGSDTTFKVSPSVSAEMPALSGLSLDVSSDITIGAASDVTSVNNTSIGVGVDILSSNMLERKIELMKSERSVLEAERAITKKALEKEKSFYSSLSSILSKISSIISKQQTYYEDKISFESVKAKGYSKSSSSYRSAEMKVLNDEHEIATLEHSLIRDYKIFYMECGKKIEIPQDVDYMDLIPSDIPLVEGEDITSYKPDTYSEIESAIWTNTINSLSRSANKHYALGATAGYTFSNTATGSDSIDVGLNGSYGGLGISTGVNIPVASEGSSPAVTMAVSVSPNTFRKNKITDKTNEITEEQELLKIETAKINFGTVVQEKILEKEDILWSRTTNEENYDTYVTLEKDMYNWYKQGIITESEYLSAKVNRQACSVKTITNYIDMIIYNDSVKMMFTE